MNDPREHDRAVSIEHMKLQGKIKKEMARWCARSYGW